MMLTASGPSLSSEEHDQILQTIEMFEVITQANPHDVQSLDILKDAYQRVGKDADALVVARRLGDTYVELGQYSAAMLEYEGILQKNPDDCEVMAALGEVEERLHRAGQMKPEMQITAHGEPCPPVQDFSGHNGHGGLSLPQDFASEPVVSPDRAPSGLAAPPDLLRPRPLAPAPIALSTIPPVASNDGSAELLGEGEPEAVSSSSLPPPMKAISPLRPAASGPAPVVLIAPKPAAPTGSGISVLAPKPSANGSALPTGSGLLARPTPTPSLISLTPSANAASTGLSAPSSTPPASPGAGISLDFGNAAGPLMATNSTARQENAGGGMRANPSVVGNQVRFKDDGQEHLVKFLLQNRLAPIEAVNASLESVRRRNRDLAAGQIATSLLHEICKHQGVDRDTLLANIVDRSKVAYIPLECYDVDRSVVKMLPEVLTLGRLMVPFDVISRTVMMATLNPVDASGKEVVQQMLDYTVQWHLTSPEAMFQILTSAYRL